MISHRPMNLYFANDAQSLHADVEVKSYWDALKKGVFTCLLAWVLGVFLVVVPFVNWTMPFVFFAFGPILGIIVFFVDRRVVNRLDAETDCPECKEHFAIHEVSFSPPTYGKCPNCKAGYQVRIPELEAAD